MSVVSEPVLIDVAMVLMLPGFPRQCLLQFDVIRITAAESSQVSNTGHHYLRPEICGLTRSQVATPCFEAATKCWSLQW